MKKIILSLFAVLALSVAVPQKALADRVVLRQIMFSDYVVIETIDCYEFYEKIDGQWYLVDVQIKHHNT